MAYALEYLKIEGEQTGDKLTFTLPVNVTINSIALILREGRILQSFKSVSFYTDDMCLVDSLDVDYIEMTLQFNTKWHQQDRTETMIPLILTSSYRDYRERVTDSYKDPFEATIDFVNMATGVRRICLSDVDPERRPTLYVVVRRGQEKG